MHMYEYIMKSKKPHEIATYDTIVYPYDAYIWIFIIVTMLAQFLALHILQRTWSFLSGQPNPRHYIFEG